MAVESSILHLLSVYQFPAIFFGAFFLGETIIIAAAFLAAHGVWSTTNVFVLALLGTLLSDSLWFFFGQQILKTTHKWDKYYDKYNRLVRFLDRVFGDKQFLSLLFIKFLYGTRILTIIYLSMRALPYKIFLLFDMMGCIIWLVPVIAIGWFAGKGIDNVFPIFDNIGYIVICFVSVIILFKGITIWISKVAEKSQQ